MKIKLLLALACVNVTIAQNTTGVLETVETDGLYEIQLPNQIRSFSNRNLSDFRILDAKGKEVPYFIREKSSHLTTSEYVPFELVSKETLKDTSTTIVFNNPFKVIEDIVFSIANYSGSKSFKISGSNDGVEWFGVLNSGRLSNLEGTNSVSVDKAIRVPSCSYKYLKIIVNDVGSLPINILKIGGYANAITNRALQKVNTASVTTVQLSEEKTTQIHIKFKNKEILNQVEFNVLAPDYFNRDVIIYKKVTRVIKKKEETYKQRLASFQLNSDSPTNFNIQEIFENDIFIEIENKDSNHLVFEGINFFQKPLYVITTLKANASYTITTGSDTIKAPEYDLSFFRHNISENLPRVQIKNVVKQDAEEVAKQIPSFWQQSWFMWACISITGLFILFFTSSLVKDLKKD
ncbi:hypothetical protein [Olleya sp. Bg11-27]|uniref:hypothetical protein n=1 Tax=Olleya sp. Bg11-27 TaxID=2058135 RepID=UPI000C2FFDE6|nr:hypothetical protein [Olleya sp. Bg11-27]AUC74701.1 hypothetical protein CW732_03015 [Olleya sp. Bg11-27]